MPYRTDGSSHHSGIANEHAVVDFINSRSISIREALLDQGDTLVHVGGTKSKIDATIIGSDGNSVNIGISIKNHKEGTGTFDWINTTQFTGFMKQELVDFKNRGVQDRTEFDAIFERNIRTVSDDIIRSILQYCSDENPEYILINNEKNEEYVLASMPDLQPLKEWVYFLKFGNGKTSGAIWRRQGELEVDTNLRLRLVSNNGFHALFSKSSVPTFKIQQERVGQFIEGLVGSTRERY